jgi:uncharacterized protein
VALIEPIVRTLSAMGWEILWPLVLGFTLSGIVQAVVSHSEMSRMENLCQATTQKAGSVL